MAVAETLVSLLLTFLILALGAALVVAVARNAGALARTTDEVFAERMVWRLLRAELGQGVSGRDWSVDDAGEIALRAFRGVAVACGPARGSQVEVLVAGVRVPAPEKDSVLVLGPDGAWTAADLTGVWSAEGGCGAPPLHGWRRERWTVAPPPSGVPVLRFFERGSYHLEDTVFRYRVGEGGRQPVTPPVFRDRAAGFRVSGDGVVVDFGLADGDSVGARRNGWERRIRGQEGGG